MIDCSQSERHWPSLAPGVLRSGGPWLNVGLGSRRSIVSASFIFLDSNDSLTFFFFDILLCLGCRVLSRRHLRGCLVVGVILCFCAWVLEVWVVGGALGSQIWLTLVSTVVRVVVSDEIEWGLWLLVSVGSKRWWSSLLSSSSGCVVFIIFLCFNV